MSFFFSSNRPTPSTPRRQNLSSSSSLRSSSLSQLHWDERNHFIVLTKLHGSVWPRVWPFCFINTISTLFVFWLRQLYNINLTSESEGHRYMAMVMSFLVVTRVKIIYDRYMAESKAFVQCQESCRDLVATTCQLTAQYADEKPKLWRHDVAFATLDMLACTLKVLQLRSHQYRRQQQHAVVTKLPDDLRVHNVNDDDEYCHHDEQDDECESSPLHMLSSACRAPGFKAMEVRRAILQQRFSTSTTTTTTTDIDLFPNHPCNEELRLLNYVTKYLEAFAVIETYTTTPMPFPLVQMCKTFLFVWLFSLPFVLPCRDKSTLVMTVFIVVLITYGFVGLECVAVELTDCWGEDPCDLDDEGQAEQCCEDCYISIYKLDGMEWAMKLRDKIHERYSDVFSQCRPQQSADSQSLLSGHASGLSLTL